MNNLNLEVSLKPYYGLDYAATRAACDAALRQWGPLVARAESVSVMFWAADGSEILDYAGDLDAGMEWARFLGNANPLLHPEIASDPEGKSLHARSYLYRDDALPITYRRFAEIIRAWREAIAALGKQPRLGLTFDPGGEFSPSSFKYERHREICLADTMGKASFVCCYGSLNADTHRYAGFPDGIPQGTGLGTFLGRQFKLLARDLHLDFLWLSNGFGFGMETWMTSGPLFDGVTFTPEKAPETREKILRFWRDFRHECPDLGVLTRGTNLGTATDLSSDATPLREIYEGGFNMDPPPNSPWAALNGDFGIELAGYMGRIAELPPGKQALYRFYIHDPWWLNSPWLDRYERQPHDIYLPLAIARIDAEGRAEPPQNLSLLSLDDSYGYMPDAVPNEVQPHLLRAWAERPDAPGPVVWLYPFDEIHDAMFGASPQPERLFHADWFAREALNDSVPLNTVVSTRSWRALGQRVREVFSGRIVVTPAPFDASGENLLLAWADAGGALIVYGPLDHAPRLRERLGLQAAQPLDGEFTVASPLPSPDSIAQPIATRYFHQNVMCGGGLGETPIVGTAPSVVARNAAGEIRALHARSGSIEWLRGALPMRLTKRAHLPERDNPATTFPFSSLVRHALAQHGWRIALAAHTHDQRHPVITLHRQAGAWFFSGYTPDTTVELALGTPYGAPLFLGTETRVRGATSTHRLARAWRHECRVFVRQDNDTPVSCREQYSGEVGIRRRLTVHGLKDAVVTFFPDTTHPLQTVRIRRNEGYLGTGAALPFRTRPDGSLVIEHIDGDVLISW